MNDWAAFTGFDTTSTEVSVIEAAFSELFPRARCALPDIRGLELQGRSQHAVIGEMRDALIDNYS